MTAFIRVSLIRNIVQTVPSSFATAKKMIFGKEGNKGLVLDGLKLKAVTIGEGGYTMDDVLVHDAHEKKIRHFI